MAKRQSRIPEKRREYQGEEFVQPLINWFNLSPDKDGQARVGTIMALYAALKNKRDIPGDDDPRSPKDLEEALNQALRYFQLTPTIYIHEATDNPRDWRAVTGWEPVPDSQLAKNLQKAAQRQKKYVRASPERFFYKGGGTAFEGVFMGEHDAMKIALRIIETGWFWQVGPCTCGTIFFRRFKHQRFCSEKCRIAAFRSSDEARRRRNEYARELYHTKKALEEGKRR